MTRTSFDLITVDVVDPRDAAAWCVRHAGLVIVDDEDDGRWVVVADADGRRVLGFQRCDARELRHRGVSVTAKLAVHDTESASADRAAPRVELVEPDDWGSHCAAVVRSVDVDLSARFWSRALGLGIESFAEPVRVLTGTSGAPLIECRAEENTDPRRPIVHLDPQCALADFGTELDRLVDLGAICVGPTRIEHWGTTQILTAPDGAIFCLNAYR